ncbi:anthranilate synthase family protein [Kitasatospora phosalacinea]|uniref:anthranilate synthase family protein n=1 Tax=Kitasatospora phosalacinea TaxID=2065 RepID=UPI00364C244B
MRPAAARTAAAEELLAAIVSEDPPPFAVLHRPEAHGGPGTLDLIVGGTRAVGSLADVPRPPADGGGPGHDVLVLVPFRQITERGFACVDDGAPLLALTVREQAVTSVADFLRRMPDTGLTADEPTVDLDDEEYARTVRRVVEDEIGTGTGANFVLRRTFRTQIENYHPRSALTLFRRLLEREQNAYWTYIVHTGDRTLVGATPERHVSVEGGRAVMNPISGTYRYPESGPTLEGVLAFLDDTKESDELYMVLDEELKMMGRICPEGGRVTGPHLKEMARVAHTEYYIEGRTAMDPRTVLRETMFAPTVTGSPLESACRVIARHEPTGRSYYSGIVALIGRDADGGDRLDSAIVIRSAEIDRAGRTRVAVGSTLVRHSDPRSEAAETRAKASAVLAALATGPGRGLSADPRVRAALRGRNTRIADYWLAGTAGRGPAGRRAEGLRVLVVDAEDTFTVMLAQQLRTCGHLVTVRRFDEPHDPDAYDLTVLGPGPGDPQDDRDPRIRRLRGHTRRLLATGRPFLSVCLSHQVLSLELGLPVSRLDRPNQGVQREIDLFGEPQRVGFYNTFSARSGADRLSVPGLGEVEVCRDRATGVVHALRGAGFASVQFHPESVLTRGGVDIVGSVVDRLSRRSLSTIAG